MPENQSQFNRYKRLLFEKRKRRDEALTSHLNQEKNDRRHARMRRSSPAASLRKSSTTRMLHRFRELHGNDVENMVEAQWLSQSRMTGDQVSYVGAIHDQTTWREQPGTIESIPGSWSVSEDASTRRTSQKSFRSSSFSSCATRSTISNFWASTRSSSVGPSDMEPDLSSPSSQMSDRTE